MTPPHFRTFLKKSNPLSIIFHLSTSTNSVLQKGRLIKQNTNTKHIQKDETQGTSCKF